MAEKAAVPKPSTAAPGHVVPSPAALRLRLRRTAADYVRDSGLKGPIPLDELLAHAAAVAAKAGGAADWTAFAAVLVSNELWRNAVAAVPYERRLLLLPQCLRVPEACPAEMDELGLCCRQCGRCAIGLFKGRAEKLGYAVLVAEGAPAVMALLAGGALDAVIGVGCLDVLEKSFPYMHGGLIPGIAIPLLRDGCRDTDVDADWVWEAVYSRTADAGESLGTIRSQVACLFNRRNLRRLLAARTDPTAALAVEWMAAGGRRRRPLLAAMAYRTLSGKDLPRSVRDAAVAVECFHKASLVHDDIEDQHLTRYGRKTVHAANGTAVAVNVGDFLVGEGYRILSALRIDDGRKSRLLAAAARGHRDLCTGQGRELLYSRPEPLKVKQILEVFRQKTAPAFQVALKIGAILAGAGRDVTSVLDRCGDFLGTAYQIRDDLDDYVSGILFQDSRAMKCSILFALAWRRARGGNRRMLQRVWTGETPAAGEAARLKRLFASPAVEGEAADMLRSYIADAAEAACSLQNEALKGLLQTFLVRIFQNTDPLVCCDEHRKRNA